MNTQLDILDVDAESGPPRLAGADESGREFLFVNSAFSVGSRAIAGLTRVGILLGIARVYGPGSFGQVTLAISLVEILRTFSEFGVDTVSIRKFAQVEPVERPQLLASIAGTKLILGIFFYCIGVGLLFFVADNRTEIQLGLIAGLTLLFASVLGAISSYFQSFFSMSRVFRTTAFGSTVSIIFATVSIYTHAPLLLVMVALPMADAANLLLISRRLDVPFRMRFAAVEALSLLRESLPVGIMAVFVVLYVRLDNVFVFKFAGAASLGLYALCYRLIEPGLMVPAAFSTTTYALLSRPRHQDGGVREVAGILLKSMWPSYALIAVVLVALPLVGKLFLKLAFPNYLAAYPVLIVLGLVLAVRAINVTLTAVLNSRAKYSLLARIAAVNLAFNIVLVLLLVPKLGALGAAWAALGTECLNTLMQGRSAILVCSGLTRSS